MRRQILLPVLGLLLLAPAAASAGDLSGTWYFGAKESTYPPEPKQGAYVVVVGGCTAPPRRWTLAVKDGHATLSSSWREAHMGGAWIPAPGGDDEAASGTFDGVHLVLEGRDIAMPGRPIAPRTTDEADAQAKGEKGEKVVWKLEYDAETGHLHGTRNGKAVWGAPLDEKDTGQPCLAPRAP